MADKNQIKPIENIQNLIFTIRGVQVMLDSDLAQLYSVETKNLNRAVNRNIERFPEKYRFQITKEEWENLQSQLTNSGKSSLRFQNGTLKEGRGKHRKYLPYVFTEQGVAVTIYTKNISKILKQDLQKYNSQYPEITIKKFSKAHDRFLIIDETTIYHIGASLKDLGKKWVAFSKMDLQAMEMITNLKNGGGNE